MFLLKTLNWKKYPIGVFFYAIPLAVLGIGLQLLLAIIQFTINHDSAYLIILLMLSPLAALPIIVIVKNKKLFINELNKLEKGF